ncbi:MAG: DUF6653 family protein [Pseudomonadota bacterium]
MDIFKIAERSMRMDDRAWARHGNPWSAYTRLGGSVPLFFALYSGHWIGWWALIPIGAMIAWTLINPRLFPPPDHTKSWATRGVLGERVFLNRHTVAIPAEHLRIAHLTTGLSAFFVLIAIYGFWTGTFWTAFSGFAAAVMAKTWFVDRMAWLWDDMKDSHPTYAAWDGADWTATMESPA